jgi:deoxyribonuclease-4
MTLKVGFHVSISGAISNSIDNATHIGCTAFQIFSRNPRGWSAKPLDTDDVKLFHTKLKSSGIDPASIVVHMPYLPNLAAPDGETYNKSVVTLADEIKRCNTLGIRYLVVHLGSHMGAGQRKGIEQIVKACASARDSYKKDNNTQDRVTLLLENSAGQKNSIGSRFEEIIDISDMLDGRNYGICLDTCHAFVAGYDLRTEKKVNDSLASFESVIGFDKLKIVHLNDSKGEMGSNLDRHEHIGMGKIGREGFSSLLKNKYLRSLPLILETPVDSRAGDTENLKTITELSGET